LITFSLQSGSSGNSVYVEAGDVRLLFDAGISAREAQGRMARHGRDIRQVTALILSHEHGDHSRCASTWHRLFRFPIYLTPLTHRALGHALKRTHDLRYFLAGGTLEFGPVRVHTLRTPHDAVDGVAFVVECDNRRLGIFSDLGNPFDGLRAALSMCDAAYLESNYDPAMLMNSAYSPQLKARICGAQGHLSNGEAAELVNARSGPPLQWLSLAHLSEHNNHPELALSTHRALLGDRVPLGIASRDAVSPLMSVC